MILSPRLRIEKNEIEKVKKVINGISKNHSITCLRGATMFSSVGNFISTLVHYCGKEWNHESASSVFDVVVRLLTIEWNTDVEESSVVTLLAPLILLAGRCCGKMTLLIPPDEYTNDMDFLHQS